MKKPLWHHKPDLPDRDQEIIRNVYFGDAAIGRIRKVEHGPKKGKWQWSGRWGGLVDGKPVQNSGECDDREQALAELRSTAIEQAKIHPSIMLWVFEHQPYGKHKAQYYLTLLQSENTKT